MTPAPSLSPLAQALPPGVRFIERDWLSSNMVLMFDADGATLVDSGYVKHAALTESLVRQQLQAARSPALVRIINTHLHSDHCGGNAQLVRAFGCKVRIPKADAASVADWDETRLNYVLTGQRLERFAADEFSQPGDEWRLGAVQWQALAAPGHDPHSLILYSPTHRLLISADALWENGFGINFTELAGNTSGFDEQAAVLDLISHLPIDCVMPGHGPMFSDVRAALARAYTLLERQRGDPKRHARHTVKVLVKYLLLDLEQVPLPRLVADAAKITVVRQCLRVLGATDTTLDTASRELVEEVISELVAQGAARRQDAVIFNA